MEKRRQAHLIYMICIYKWGKILVGIILFLIVACRTEKTKPLAELKMSATDSLGIYWENFEAIFPGGDIAWGCFLRKKICKHIGELEDTSGKCSVEFAIDADGVVKEVRAITMKGTVFARVVVEAVRESPKWRPATMNGKNIKSYRVQKFSLQQSDNSQPCECHCGGRKKRHSA